MIINEMNEEFDHRTTDKGWTAMRDLLDREMPVEQRRRRFIWWWFVFLLLPLAAFGGWHLWTSGAAKTPESSPKTIPGNPQKSTLPMASRTDAPNSGFLSDNSSKPSDASVVRSGPANRNANQERAQTVHPGKPARSLSTLPPEGYKAVEPGSLNDHAVQAEQPETNAIPALIAELSTASGNRAKAKNLEALRSLPMVITRVGSEKQASLHFLNPPVSMMPDKNIIAKKAASDWTLGISMAAGMESISGFSSMSGGPTVHWQVGRRFGLRSGVQYNRHTPASSHQPVAIVSSTKFESALDSSYYNIIDSNGNTATPATADLLNAVVIPVARVQLLEVPLMASWNAFHWLKIFGGLNTGYIIAAQTGVESYSGQYALRLNSGSGLEKLNTLAARDIPRWRFDAQTGFGLGIGKRLECSIFVKWPLSATNIVSNASKDQTSVNGNFDPDYSQSLKKRTPSLSLSATYFFRR